MGTVVVKLPGPLQPYAGGASELQADAGTVAELLDQLGERHPQLLARVLDPEGGLRPFVNVFVGRVSVRALQGLATPVPPGEVVSILPAVAGG